MKKLSNLMGVMWEADSNKSLWSLMTKAWSVIRDQIGKDKAPLDRFFRIICPYLNIPSPETYLDHCGWTLSSDEEGTPALARIASSSPKDANAGIAGMTLSVEDIINYCQSMGYAQEYMPDSGTYSPTFLAQSHNHSSNSVKSQTQFANSVHETRLAARNKRRAKRQTAKTMNTVPALQQQIVHAHNTDDLNAAYHDTSFLETTEPVQFFGDLAGFFSDHIERKPQGISGASGDFAAGEDPVMTHWADWSAFRLGADENATLPSFDFAAL